MATSRKPDYVLKAYNKKSGTGRKVGAGWINDNGSISVAVDSFVFMANDPDISYTLWPEDGSKHSTSVKSTQPPAQTGAEKLADMDDDIPF